MNPAAPHMTNWREAGKPVLRAALLKVSPDLATSPPERVTELLAPFNVTPQQFVAQALASGMPQSGVAGVLARDIQAAVEQQHAAVVAAFGSFEQAAIIVLQAEIEAAVAQLGDAPPSTIAAETANVAPGGGPVTAQG